VACAFGALAPGANASLGVPTGGTPQMFTGSGASTAAAMANFEQAVGGADNGTAAGEHGDGFRHVTWDQIAPDGSDPGSTSIRSGVIAPARNRLQPWGLELGPNISVSSNGFQSVSSTQFTPFTASNIWGPFNSDTAEFDVVAPSGQGGTPVPAQARGLGIVFLNSTGSATIQYFNGGSQLAQGTVTALAGATSFAGLLFPDAVVTRVVVTLGGSATGIFGWNGTAVTQGGSGSVAGDDVVLAEPGPKLSATAGVPISPVLDSVSESNPSAYVSATIDWGDGTRTTGAISPAAGGALDVSGTHAYPEAGTYNALVTVDDSDGSEQTSNTVIQVAPRATATSLTCSPSPVAVTASTICTATVSDLGAFHITPTGTVAVSSPTAGASFGDDSGCVLGATATPGVAICEVAFTPTELPPAQARVDAVYGGDGTHVGSSASAIVRVRAQRCTMKALPARLKRHPAVLGVLVTCDARANVTIGVRASAARKGGLKAFSLQFGSLRTTVTAGRPTVLVVKPSKGVLPALHTATRRGQRTALLLTLTASSHATRTSTTTRVAALRIR